MIAHRLHLATSFLSSERNRLFSLEEHQRVEFEVNQGPKGPQAVHVRAV